MTSSPDLKIVDADIQRLTLDLKAIAQAFVDDTHAASDVGGALGHQRLAEEFTSFSESWRVNRERMQKNIDELATAMGNIKVATDEVDRGLAGPDGQNPAASSQDQNPSQAGARQPPAASGGVTPGGAPAGPVAASPSDSLPAATAAAQASGTATPDAPAADPATPPPTDDDTTVRVGADGDFYAAVTIGGAGAAGATATLMALYKLWDAHRGQVTGNAAPSPEAEQADARSRLLAGLQELGGDGKEVSVELVSEGQSPDHVTAILKGEDGRVEVLDLSPGDAGGTPADEAGSGEATTGNGATDATSDATIPSTDPSGDTGGDPSGSGGEAGASSDAGDSLPKASATTEAGGGGQAADPGGSESLPAVSASGSPGAPEGAAPGLSAGHADAATALPSVAATGDATPGGATPGDGSTALGVQSPQVAGATAGMGLAGMGAVSATGMGQGSATAPARNQSETLRKVTESTDDERAKEQQR